MVVRHMLVPVALLLAGCGSEDSPTPTAGKLYVANEDDGNVSVVDDATREELLMIDLADPDAPGMEMPMPHNVQVAPDGRSVWVTAPSMQEGGEESAIVIDPATDRIVARIALGSELHVAHVVLDPSSRWAYVTANEGQQVLRIDAEAREVVDRWDLGEGRTPHGARHCAGKLWVADMEAGVVSILDPESGPEEEVEVGGLAVLDPESGPEEEVEVGGLAVQTACTPDQRYVFVSLYDTIEVVRLDAATRALERFALPEGSQGPIQSYPTPDSRTLYVADQGNLAGRPASNRLYEMDVDSGDVRATIEVGLAAHGVVVSEDGKRIYVTNQLDDSVSIVDAATRQVIATVGVGAKPNGVSHWHADGGTP